RWGHIDDVKGCGASGTVPGRIVNGNGDHVGAKTDPCSGGWALDFSQIRGPTIKGDGRGGEVGHFGRAVRADGNCSRIRAGNARSSGVTHDNVNKIVGRGAVIVGHGEGNAMKAQ